MANIGIVAGGGKLPIIFSDVARKKGDKVLGMGLKGVTDPELEDHVDKFIWFEKGAVQKAIMSLVTDRINRIVLLGKLRKDLFFKGDEGLDAETKAILGKLNDRRDYSLLNEGAKFLGKFGIEIMDPSPYLTDLIPQKGVLTKRAPTKEEAEDIDYGNAIARELTRFDIGQTVLVKLKTVIALEAVEGTDQAIARAGQLSKKGFVAVKIARPDQDMRFDVPLVGPETLEAISKAGGTALALESGRTFLMDRQEVVRFADEKGIAVVII